MTPEQLQARVQRRFMALLGISGAAERQWVRLSAEAAPAKDGEVLLYGPIVDDMEAECMNDLTEYDTMVSAQMVRARLNEIEGDVTARESTLRAGRGSRRRPSMRLLSSGGTPATTCAW